MSCIIGCSMAATAGGATDILGNYYDGTTGQISSSLTGRVYNTRPTGWGPVVGAPVYGNAAYAAAPLAVAAPLHAPLVAGLHAPLHAPLLAAPAYGYGYAGNYFIRR